MKALAHRGAEAYSPENTFSSFKMAIKMKADGIETDIRQTKDGMLVLFHDTLIGRTTSGIGDLQEMNWRDIKYLDAGTWYSEKFKDERIPLLENYLKEFGNKIPSTDLEIKREGYEQKVLMLVNKYNLINKVIFTSFNLSSLIALKQLDSKARTGLLTNDISKLTFEIIIKEKINQFSPPADLLTKEFVNRCHLHGLYVRAWGVKNDKLMQHAINCGVDSMTVSDPLKFLKLTKHS